MSDENIGKLVTPSEAPYQKPTLVQTISDTPVIFADGVINQVIGPGISKFHFYRQDSVVGNVDAYVKREVLQVVMPATAFADMVAFFEHRLRVMVARGNIPQEIIDERREFYGKYPV